MVVPESLRLDYSTAWTCDGGGDGNDGDSEGDGSDDDGGGDGSDGDGGGDCVHVSCHPGLTVCAA